jgi:very-short-patch-repair endonuclease
MRQQSDTPGQTVAGIAARQHGVLSFAQLRSAGLSKGAIARRSRSGHLHRVHRGVYAVGHTNLSPHGKWMAAVLACRKEASVTHPVTILAHWGAAISHRSAATLWQLLPDADGPVDVSAADTAGRKKRHGIRLHRCRALLPAFVTSHQGIPVTTPARTIADLRSAAVQPGRLGGAITPQELRRAIRQAEMLGLKTDAESFTERTRSDLELAFLRLCRRSRVPEPEVNICLDSLEVDFLWREQLLVVESDGYRYHRGRTAFEKDRDRDLKLRARGYEVLRLSYRQVFDEPARVAYVLKLALGRD